MCVVIPDETRTETRQVRSQYQQDQNAGRSTTVDLQRFAVSGHTEILLVLLRCCCGVAAVLAGVRDDGFRA